jgi:hypothetical protein
MTQESQEKAILSAQFPTENYPPTLGQQESYRMRQQALIQDKA